MTNIRITHRVFECIDGRKTLAVLAPTSGGGWRVYERGSRAAAIAGPQLPGASLFVVYLAQKYFALDLQRAFEFAQLIHADMHMQPAFHVDTHANSDLGINSSDRALELYGSTHTDGCGFARFAWQYQVSQVIEMAKDFGWWIFVLCDEHAETGAHLNFAKGTTLSRPGFEGEDPEAFNMDMWSLDQVIDAMILNWPGFSITVASDVRLVADENLAMQMHMESGSLYAQLVKALSGINPDQIVYHGELASQ